MMISGKVYQSEDNSAAIPKKLAGIIKCKCWCHDEGTRERVCVKCLGRMATGEEQLSDFDSGAKAKH